MEGERERKMMRGVEGNIVGDIKVIKYWTRLSSISYEHVTHTCTKM